MVGKLHSQTIALFTVTKLLTEDQSQVTDGGRVSMPVFFKDWFLQQKCYFWRPSASEQDVLKE